MREEIRDVCGTKNERLTIAQSKGNAGSDLFEVMPIIKENWCQGIRLRERTGR